MVLSSTGVRTALVLSVLVGLAPNLAAQGCKSGRGEPDLGVGGMDCLLCTLHVGTAAEPQGWIAFGAEPTLRLIRAGGPADGVLRDGDVLVAVDGMLITTEAGSRRFAAPATGKPLRLTVRRTGRELTVAVIPAAGCAPSPGSSQTAPAAPPQPTLRAARGWLGIGLRCSWCSSQEQPDGALAWSFEGFPEVVAVDDAGPAGPAGLRPGDLLRAIDGVSLLTAEGGRRFGAVRPGDRVTLTFERQGVRRTVAVTAAQRRSAGR
jgi:S1-C subfamily serine protease